MVESKVYTLSTFVNIIDNFVNIKALSKESWELQVGEGELSLAPLTEL